MEENGELPDEWNYQLVEENVINEFFSYNNKRSIAQRRAEKCGFSASGISIPAMSPPPARETFLTIPSGLTPTAFLDSPVMLPNSQAPQSPTTGSFQKLPIMINQENSMSTPHAVINANCPIKTNNVIDPFSFPSFSNTQSQSTLRYPFEFPAESQVTNTTKVGNCSLRGEMNSNIITSNGSDDGYTWRKYGQKTVKGNEFPRSYYKCTQQNCLVKKKVERSPDGQITEIIYKGEHNHHKSQPLRRATMCSNSYDLVEMSKGNGVCKNMQFEGSLKRTSPPSILTKNSDLLILNQKTNVNVFDIAEITPEPSSTLASCDDEDRATEGSTSLGNDVDDNEFEHKRRRREFYPAEINLSSRTTREPRVVVQIESNVDILDDGYRWRKYGQKVVKGNPNPRSYYKCTSAGCPVRKHVERAPDNLKSVMTTYEGKHNHEVPTMNKTNGVATTATVENQVSDSILNEKSSTFAFSKIHKISNLGTQVQDFNFQFERKPFECFLENQVSDLRCGVPLPLYDLRFLPNLQSPLPYNSHLFTLQMPNFSLPLNFPIDTNIVPPLDEFHFNDLPLTSNGASSESSLAIGDQKVIPKNNNNNNNKKLRPLKVNQEIRNENLYDYQNGTSVLFRHVMENFPS